MTAARLRHSHAFSQHCRQPLYLGRNEVLKSRQLPRLLAVPFCRCALALFSSSPLLRHCYSDHVSHDSVRVCLAERKDGIANAHYQVGRAELLLPEIHNQLFAEDLSAVVNPGRAGLSARATRALRGYSHIKRLVYIACQPEGAAMDNFVE
ncbi:hypothetical protein V5799_024403 [Amblyomma americanum]|uniref:Uncharacterized protein n=1 Tax=Amblyomma americanum TaxID=6943 RepID=A0AAQ4ECN6_AMBAM